MHRLVLAQVCARLYVAAVVMSGVVGALTFVTQSFPGKGRAYSRIWRHEQLSYKGALTLLSRGEILRLLCCTGLYLSPILRIKLGKGGFDRCTLLYHASHDYRVRWEHASRIKCPSFCTRDTRRGNAFPLEARRFARRPFHNQRSPAIEHLAIRSTVFPYQRLGSTSCCGSIYGLGGLMVILDR